MHRIAFPRHVKKYQALSGVPLLLATSKMQYGRHPVSFNNIFSGPVEMGHWPRIAGLKFHEMGIDTVKQTHENTN